MWIRSSVWDLFWVLSGPLIAVLLYLLLAVPTLNAQVGNLASLAQVHSHELAILLTVTILLQIAHVISPVVAAWSHPGYRQIAREQWVRHLLIPFGIVVATTAIGWFAGSDLLRYVGSERGIVATFRSGLWHQPLIAICALYFAWNAWHFAGQNFGVLQLYGRRSSTTSNRWLDRGFCLLVMGTVVALVLVPMIGWVPGWWTLRLPSQSGLALTVLLIVATAAMLWSQQSLPRRIFTLNLALAPLLAIWWPMIVLRINSVIWLLHLGNYRLPDMTNPLTGYIDRAFWLFAMIVVNHWLVAIGLSSRALSRRGAILIAGGLCLAGVAIYGALFVTPMFLGWHAAGLIVVTTTAIGLRRGLDFTHFWYDRRLYRRNSPIWVNQEAAHDRPRHSSPAILSPTAR